MIRLFLFALALGIAAAIPIGACQIEAAKRAISGHLRAALMVALGSGTSDALYGAVALFGVAPAFERPRVLAAFSAAGVLILWILAYRTWRASRRPHELDLRESSLASRRRAFVTGFLLGASNPPIILSWLLGVAAARWLGLPPVSSLSAKAAFVGGGTMGLGGYLAVMSVATCRVRHFFSVHAIGAVYRWLSVALLVLSLYFLSQLFACARGAC